MQNSNNFKGHYGLEFVLNCTPEEVAAKVEELKQIEEGVRFIVKPNRKVQKRTKPSKNYMASSLARANDSLRMNLGTSMGEVIEADLNRKFRNLWKLRQKS